MSPIERGSVAPWQSVAIWRPPRLCPLTTRESAWHRGSATLARKTSESRCGSRRGAWHRGTPLRGAGRTCPAWGLEARPGLPTKRTTTDHD